MTRKEINEIKSQFNIEDCGIQRLCGCYVDGEKNKVTTFNDTFLNLPEEERHKYLDILRKCLSAAPPTPITIIFADKFDSFSIISNKVIASFYTYTYL